MKISYYEMFNLISEEATDLLTEHMSKHELENIYQNFNYKTTIEDVMEMIPKNKKRKRVSLKGRLLVAILMLMVISSTAFAVNHLSVLEGGVELVSDKNKHLIGKELTYNDNIQEVSSDKMDVFGESSIVKKVEKDTHIPRFLEEFTVTEKDGVYIVPEFMFTNDAMVILKKEDGSGWKLKEGESLQIQLELYPSEINKGKGQSIMYQHVFDGQLMKETNSKYGLFQNYELKASKSGEYYICLVGASSDSITIKKGEMY